MKRGDVYLARLDPVVGSEQAGKRPVILVSRDAINAASPVVVVVPCTRHDEKRRIYPSQIVLRAAEGGLRNDSIVLGEQVRALSKKRLEERWGTLDPATMRHLDRALLITLDLPGAIDP